MSKQAVETGLNSNTLTADPLDSMPSLSVTTGQRLARLLQRLARLDQIHIIGCSRSGTTAVQFAMIAFRDVIIANGETSANYPYLTPLLRHIGERSHFLRRRTLITKRNPGWHRRNDVEALIRRVRDDGIGIVHLVRDPRDVLSSVHVKAGDTPYVTPELWLQSISAAQRVRESTPPGGRFVTLRYEDFVLAPRRVEHELRTSLGLALRPGVVSLSEVKTNIENSGYRIDDGMLANMHRLRNLDSHSLYRWRRQGFDINSRIKDPMIRNRISSFISEFSYPIDGSDMPGNAPAESAQ